MVTPAGLLDSYVVLDAGGGNRGLGRCTLDVDPESLRGLCTFSDGTGQPTVRFWLTGTPRIV